MSDVAAPNALTLVIFGLTGDLAQRKLQPAIYELLRAGRLPENLRIVGVSRRDLTVDEVYAHLPEFVAENGSFDEGVGQKLKASTEMCQMDLENSADYESLRTRLQEIDAAYSEPACRIYYLSIPSQAFPSVVRLLGQTGHATVFGVGQQVPRLLIEKPFGSDLSSAKQLVEVIGEHFTEDQVFRIDHYVAKESVQNMQLFRFSNPLFERTWNNQHIACVAIRAREQIGIEGRVTFYEETGALRDVVQNHLLQLLAIVGMARPRGATSTELHEAKLRLLQAVVPVEPEQVVRGQYEGYREEVKNETSTIETFVRLEVAIDNDQWRGVPITLETGKALSEKLTQIEVTFAPSAVDQPENKLIFRIQPHEGISLQLQMKRPGLLAEVQRTDMQLDTTDGLPERPAEAYERVLTEAVAGNHDIFATADEIVRSWELIQPILDQWAQTNDDLVLYRKSSAGPVGWE